jgi:hypothetical protein
MVAAARNELRDNVFQNPWKGKTLTRPVYVRVFGSLRPLRLERGLPCEFEVEVPEEGVTGRELAELVDLPAERIEGIFVNHVVLPLDTQVSPGDRTAFVPYGTPGPHRLYLGLYEAGQASEDEGEASS